MIKAVIFDCFGVLTTDLWKEFRSSLPDELQKEAQQLNHTYDAGLITETEFISKIRELTGRSPVEPETLPKTKIAKNKELLDYIRQLKTTYKIGLLSNIASNWIREEFLTTEEQAMFDEMVMSYEVHMTKPDPRIFALACQRLGIEAKEAVFIDDIEAYCEAAKALGMQTVVYQDFGRMKGELDQILAANAKN